MADSERRRLPVPQSLAELKKIMTTLESEDAEYRPSEADLEFLPLQTRLRASLDQSSLATKLANIKEGLVNKATVSRWGLRSSEDGVGDLDDPVLNLLTIREPHPSGRGFYILHYVFCNNFNNKYNDYIERHKATLKADPCYQIILKSLRHAYETTMKLRTEAKGGEHLPYEFTAIERVYHFFATMEQREPDDWVAALLFSVVDPLTSSTSLCSDTQSVMAVCVGELKKQYVNLPAMPFFTIRIPKFSYVGNLEATSLQGVHKSIHDTYESYLPMRKASEELNAIRAVLKQRSGHPPIPLKAGSCSLLMSFTMMRLRQLRYPIMYLSNDGGIGGCKCYVTSALANNMVTFAHKHKENWITDIIKAILTGGGLDSKHTTIIRNISEFHCDPQNHLYDKTKLDPPPLERITGHTQELLFIDIRTAIRMFKFGHAFYSKKHNSIPAEHRPDKSKDSSHSSHSSHRPRVSMQSVRSDPSVSSHRRLFDSSTTPPSALRKSVKRKRLQDHHSSSDMDEE